MLCTRWWILFVLVENSFTEVSPQGINLDKTVISYTIDDDKKLDKDVGLHLSALNTKESHLQSENNATARSMKTENTNILGKVINKTNLQTTHSDNYYSWETILHQTKQHNHFSGNNSDNWTTVAYTNNKFQLKAWIQIAYLNKNYPYVTFLDVFLLRCTVVVQNEDIIKFSITLQDYSVSSEIYNITVTVSQKGDVYLWSEVDFQSVKYGQVMFSAQAAMEQFKTRRHHAYRCSAPATIFIDDKLFICISNLYYRAFITDTALQQVDGCQGSLTYQLYGTVGGLCVFIILVTMTTVIVKYRQRYKLRAAYENMDSRFQP